MKKSTKVFSVLVALLLVAVSVFPAFAVEPTTAATGSEVPQTGLEITIEPGEMYKSDKTGLENRYVAYQIFSGRFTGITNQLADIQWGKGVDGDQLLAELKLSQVTASVREKQDDGYVDKEGETTTFAELFASADSAKKVADVLATYQDDSQFMRDFAKIVAKHIKEAEGKKSVLDGEKGEVEGVDNRQVKIKGLDAGYYLVVDTYSGTNQYDAASAYMLDVVENTTINLKNDLPDVDKNVVDNGELITDSTGEIGKIVTFHLSGTLPDNYDRYDTYVYKFVDTLSEGLSFNSESVKVYASKNGDSADVSGMTEIPQTVSVSDPEPATVTNYTVTNPAVNATFSVDFTDLKSLKAADGTTIEITKDTTIVVVYTATVNEKALIDNANTNEVYLEYSNNPNSDSTGKTTEKRVDVYTFGIEIFKKNGSKDTDTPLPGVGFKIYKKVDGQIKWATFTNEKKDGKTIYKLSGWVDDEANGTQVVTDNDGKLYVDGFDLGEYSLKEVSTPSGFDTIADITVTITATDIAGTTKVPTVTISSPEDEAQGDGTSDENRAKMNVVNYEASKLPGTGGIGTTIFYIVGGALVAIALVAVIVMNIRKKKGTDETSSN